MDLLGNPAISQQLASRPYFDLQSNNDRLNVIYSLYDEPVQKLKESFNKIISDEKSNNGYYELQNLFTQAEMVQPDIVINLIVDSINNKIAIIKEAIFDENNKLDDIDLSMYIQIWKTYKDFSMKLYDLIKNYQNYLVDKKIKSGKVSHDILSIMQICMFYSSIIENPASNILSKISDDMTDIDKNNIEQLIDYIDSIRAFMVMKEFTTVDREKLTNIIKNIMNKTSIINIMCAYMHALLRNLTNKQAVIDESEYDTVVANDAEKKTIRKIYKISTILATYAEKNKLIICYGKFMQTRIIDLSYDNLELEIEIIRRLSGLLGKEDSQKLIDTVADIINSKNANQAIQSADIKVKSDEYKKLTGIYSKLINSIVLTRNIWKIYNISDMEPLYPLELKCYFDIINKCYASIYNNQYVVNWQPTLGSARFEAQLGQRKVDINCNILQSMAFTYLNEHTETTATSFATDTLINPELATKIFESLFEANLVIYQSVDKSGNPIYVVNIENYTGDSKIDIRRTFIETFEIEETKESTKSSTNDVDQKLDVKPMSYTEFRKMKMAEFKKEYPKRSTVINRQETLKAWKEYRTQNNQTKVVDKSKSNDESDSESNNEMKFVFDPTNKHSMYQQYISKALVHMRQLHPGKKNNEYMKMAAEAWIKYKKADNIVTDNASPAKKAPAKKMKYDPDSSSSDTDSEDYKPKGKIPVKRDKSAYQQFISKTIKDIKKKNPNLTNTQYMKKAAKAWNKYKQSNEIGGTVQNDDSEDESPAFYTPTKKVDYDSSSGSSSDSSDEEVKPKVPAVNKTIAKKMKAPAPKLELEVEEELSE